MKTKRICVSTAGLALVLVASSIAAEEQGPLPSLPESVPAVSYEGQPTPTPSPTPSPQPTPTPPEHCVYEGTFEHTWGRGQAKIDQSRFLQRSGNAATSACLEKMVSDINKLCYAKGEYIGDFSFGHDSQTHAAYYDDCFVQNLSLKLFPDFTGSRAKIGEQSNGAVCTALIRSDLRFCPDDTGGMMGCTPCGEGKVYLNEKCEVVRADDETEICGSFTTNYQASSPISLLWDEEHALEAEATSVQFPLNPYLVGRWYQWKASAAAPLVVFDPLHRGEITSGTQLFGNWTFGGRHYAALRGDHPSETSSEWADGYSALASLDANADGVLTGAELAPMGLWFDADRDGISDVGEVLTFERAGVTKLFVRSDSRDAVTGSIWASRGYERVVNGQVKVGKSVDWYGAAGNTPLDVAQKLQAQATLTAPDAVHHAGRAEQSPVPAENHSGFLTHETRISGIWEFSFDGATSSKSPAGYLVLADRGEKDGGVFGYSMVNKPFRVEKHAPEVGKVTMYGLQGVRELDSDGREVLRFTLDEGKSQIYSEAKITDDQMVGSSSLTMADGKRLSYRWTAKRKNAE